MPLGITNGYAFPLAPAELQRSIEHCLAGLRDMRWWARWAREWQERGYKMDPVEVALKALTHWGPRYNWLFLTIFDLIIIFHLQNSLPGVLFSSVGRTGVPCTEALSSLQQTRVQLPAWSLFCVSFPIFLNLFPVTSSTILSIRKKIYNKILKSLFPVKTKNMLNKPLIWLVIYL